MRNASPINSNNLCHHGCGNAAKFVTKSGKEICSEFASKCPVVKKKNSESLKTAFQTGKRKPMKNVYESLPQSKKDSMNWNKGKHPQTHFCLNGKGNHKIVLIEERGHQCEECKNTHWLGNPITLELEHIDGNNKNNCKENLKLLCPNCHSYTHTWRGRNINSGKVKISDEDLLTALNKHDTIRQALNAVGLVAKGGNYERCKKLLSKNIAPLVK